MKRCTLNTPLKDIFLKELPVVRKPWSFSKDVLVNDNSMTIGVWGARWALEYQRFDIPIVVLMMRN